MHVIVYLIVLLRELLVFTTFHMVHPNIAIHSVLHLFHTFLLFHIENTVTRMHTLYQWKIFACEAL